MTSASTPGHGYHLAPQELTAQVAALTAIGDRTAGLVDSASRLADQLPQLGTAPPAMHLAMRLRAAAGQSGLTGDVTAASTELAGFHRALRESLTSYLTCEADIAAAFRTARGDGVTR